MRIGIDASRAAVIARTGTEHYTVALLTALSALDRRNAYTLYFNRLPASLPPLGTNFTLRSIPCPRLWTHTRLLAEVLLQPPDVLFVPAHVLPFPGALRSGMRAVVTIHDLGYLAFPEAHPRAQRMYLRLSTLWNAHAADAVIVPSAHTCRDLLSHSRIPAHKVHIVFHGVDSRFRPLAPSDTAAVRAKYAINGPYFLYVGTLQPRKNLERLIDAYAQARAIHGEPFPLLILAGRRGWLSQGIEQRAAAPDIAGQVRLIGYIEDRDLPALLGGALAFVYPSLYEGFGMPVLEAMACGTPVLTSHISALPEVAGGAALLVDPHQTTAIAEALGALASDGALRERLQAQGLAHTQDWTWQRCAEQTLAVLTSFP